MSDSASISGGKLIAWRESHPRGEPRHAERPPARERETTPTSPTGPRRKPTGPIELQGRDRQRKLISKIESALARIEDGHLRLLHRDGRSDLAAPGSTPARSPPLSVEAQAERNERREKIYRDD